MRTDNIYGPSLNSYVHQEMRFNQPGVPLIHAQVNSRATPDVDDRKWNEGKEEVRRGGEVRRERKRKSACLIQRPRLRCVWFMALYLCVNIFEICVNWNLRCFGYCCCVCWTNWCSAICSINFTHPIKTRHSKRKTTDDDRWEERSSSSCRIRRQSDAPHPQREGRRRREAGVDDGRGSCLIGRRVTTATGLGWPEEDVRSFAWFNERLLNSDSCRHLTPLTLRRMSRLWWPKGTLIYSFTAIKWDKLCRLKAFEWQSIMSSLIFTRLTNRQLTYKILWLSVCVTRMSVRPSVRLSSPI